MNRSLEHLTDEEYKAAHDVVSDMRRKKNDELQRLAILKNLESIWPDGKPVIWVARQNSDLTEGRGPYRNMGYFIDKEVARQANNMLDGVMGTSNDAALTSVELSLTLPHWLESIPKNRLRRNA